ncbi:hypothetical protein HZS_1518 [Henneguya salminicola]|nr:hypothetical protein HZS_1518 [Henneguya salminicola]
MDVKNYKRFPFINIIFLLDRYSEVIIRRNPMPEYNDEPLAVNNPNQFQCSFYDVLQDGRKHLNENRKRKAESEIDLEKIDPVLCHVNQLKKKEMLMKDTQNLYSEFIKSDL